MTDRTPPHSIEAEMELIGSIFIDNDCFDEIADIVRDPAYFYREQHRLVFSVIRQLRQRGVEFTFNTVHTELEKRGQLAEAGGMETLYQLAEFAPSTAGAIHAAETVRDRYILRELARSAALVRSEALEPAADPIELMGRFETELHRLSEQRVANQMPTMHQLMHDVWNDIQMSLRAHAEGVQLGLMTGIKGLDEVTTGLHGGQLIVIAARPGHGKTSLAMTIAANVTDHDKETGEGGVLFFSLEMSAKELAARIVSLRSGVSLKDMRSGWVVQKHLDNLKRIMKDVETDPLWIADTFSLSMSEIRAISSRMVRQQGVRMIVVDYLQLIRTSGGGEKRHELIGEITRALKGLARQLEVPVIALAQLNRQIEGRAGVSQRPKLSDLRESGSIEQDADMVMFIQRDVMLSAEKQMERVRHADTLDEADRAEFLDEEPATLILAKNRAGPLDDIPLTFRKSCTRFENGSPRTFAFDGDDTPRTLTGLRAISHAVGE